MELRLAREDDRETILQIYDDGSKKLKALGLDQWQGKDKPNLDNFEELINNKNIFVLEDVGKVVSTVIIYDYDIDYENNLDGTWQSPKSYVALHRIGTLESQGKKGYGRKIIELAESYARENNFKSVRIDTHRGNKTMQGLLKSLNYEYVGLVYLSGKNERLAFEKVL
ncbi:GNAT family N-acetyltransferase [Peptoniphilus sp. DNF00840]|uniref:GNAT family N-acetyltransferase n=1 Tax=Peptoniphilus sp. DNF00840 TaxID=1477000 RepID=UPI0007868081|nr:GNAT family N-acetyltransferase [Peptoniphilus sp. DNF00840]KXB68491.1 acetyltransferase, GNAT family [Peptoniphilus sp. DNF00840]